MMKPLTVASARPAPSETAARKRFRLEVWHVLSALLLVSLLFWVGLFFLVHVAAAALRSIRA